MATEIIWDSLQRDYTARMEAAKPLIKEGKVVDVKDVVKLLEAVIKPYDRVALEGDNQKNADVLAKALAQVNPEVVNNLHMVQSVIGIPENLDLFDKGIADKVDFAYCSGVAGRLADMMFANKINVGAIHTYLELYGRLYTDLAPRVCLSVAYQADKNGNLFTGFNTEDTPVMVEATKFKTGIVICQVNEIVDELPRIDIPADWVDFVIKTDKPFPLNPLFTRDPANMTDAHVLMGMMALKGIYGEYGINRLNHGVGFDTGAVELLLPTYGEELGLKGRCCQYFMLNPHPTLIPAIESGWVKSMHSPGGEVGMEEYVATHPDIYFVGPDGNMRSNRFAAQTAGHYGIDMFIGSTLQIDKYGNSSTATKARVAGFGGAPNMGCDPHGRRHASEAWLKCGKEWGIVEDLVGPVVGRGRKLVVQFQSTFREKMAPGFVEQLDAVELAQKANMPLPPVMVYGDDITHIVTEEGIAYLHKCSTLAERMAAIRAIAGYTDIGMEEKPEETKALREKGIVKTPTDLLGADVARANRNMLAAKSIRDLVTWSKGLYNPPAKFRTW